jgi:adenosylmethionine-8-amino-7-oxononanoate aminotransferase
MIWAWDADTADPRFAQRCHRAAMDEGLLLRPIGRTLYFMPPYVIDDEAIAHLVHGAVRALDAALAA